ncbi:MAG: tRNA-dihydrouridine synthase [Paracoccaceae bacterium]|nr:MAG: tRNA-dihydrouridine synthase [Paracoccaceae bacterium]
MAISLAELVARQPVLLAPMAGITDLPFRRLVARFGAGLVTSEMVASRELLGAAAAARARAELAGGARPAAVQIVGREAAVMAEAARLCVDQGAELIDINMGCPARKVTGGLSGSALMRDPDHALRLIEAVVAAVPVPVTVKMRLGWDDTSRNAALIARRAEAAGIAMITIHGRTRCQFYSGRADWAAIAEVVRAVTIPVVANGDITDAASARAALSASGAAAVMVGRAARGAPWILAKIAAGLAGGKVPAAPSGDALCDLISEHYEEMLRFYGTEIGLRVARKHLGWYLAPLGMEALRAELVRLEDPARVLAGLRRGFSELEAAA